MQPHVEVLGDRLRELQEFKESEEDPSTLQDADVASLKDHYDTVLEELRARERSLQLGEQRGHS